MNETQWLRARWIFPADSDPIRDGCIAVCDGRIVAVSGKPGGETTDLGNVALTAGLVNVHTHLDLSLAPRPERPPTRFVDWLREIVEYRRNHMEQPVAAVAAGTDELLRSGTTVVGDVAVSQFSESCLEEAGLSGAVFREVVGLRSDRYDPLLQAALIATERESQNGRVFSSVSPHAPYSTAKYVYRTLGERTFPAPVATHWLESPEEVEFLKTGSGPMKNFLEAIGAEVDDWIPPTRPAAEYLSGSVKWLLIHANYVSDDDIRDLCTMRQENRLAGVVYCPRTHAWFGHEPHPWRRLRDRGIPVCLGTDSRATNPDLCIHSEAKFLAESDSQADPRILLKMLTETGAEALGIGDQAGLLRPGRSADIAAFALPEENSDPYSLLFCPESRPIGTMIQGYWAVDPT